MRLSQMLGQRLREAPRDAQTVSHKFLARGGYCLPVSAGIFTLMPLGLRITRKIEAIIREEMDAIGGSCRWPFPPNSGSRAGAGRA